MLLFVGILLSIATGLLGVFCLFWGVVVGIMGMGPLGPVKDLGTRFMLGGLPLVLSVVYLTPVIVFRRRSWIMAYGVITLLAAIIVVAVAMNVALVPKSAVPALFFLLAPMSALVAFIRACRRQEGDDASKRAAPERASRVRP